MSDMTGRDPASSLLDKLAAFAGELDDDERALLAALLAPGIAKAHQDDPEVMAFDGTTWLPTDLPQHLASQIRDRHLRVEGW
ncbi:MAG TPA: hypothetical protein VK866_02525 [Acidimicrobiales bacterium]|nr:hypothetical protein [Acidimicrobiales bacterium]